jgi:formamidase
LPPSAASAVPNEPDIAAHGLRTIPPRETAGNIDIKQLSKGAHLLIPVDVPGALFSAGDAHYAQGDCETCGTAIEINSTLHVRFSVRKGEAAQKNIRHPRFYRQDYYLPPEFAAPRRFYATTGISVTRDGVDQSEDVSLAARNALLNMIDHLTERGWTPQQGYTICSVAVDLKISQLVDVPNMLVSAFLPEDIFTPVPPMTRPGS